MSATLFDVLGELESLIPCPHCHGSGKVTRRAPSAGVRATDPGTSRDAAEAMSAESLAKQSLAVLRCVHDAGGVGVTASAIAKALTTDSWRPVQQNVVARRLTDLYRMGLIRKTGITRPGASGRQLTVYAVTLDGAAALTLVDNR